MTTDITKLQRWLDLVACLVGCRLPVPVDDLMERIPAYAEKWRTGDDTARASARRSFERDKKELRELGIPLETVTYSVDYGSRRREGYRLARDDFYLPYLRIASRAAEARHGASGADDTGTVEIHAAGVETAVDALERVADVPGFPLRPEARSALRKLTFDLADDDLERTPVLYPDRADAAEIAGRLRVLTEALLERERVGFRYHGIRRDAETERQVAPYGLFFQRGEWYLVGSDATRDGEVRVFRADRMEAVESVGRRSAGPEWDVPGTFEIRDYLDREAWELGEEEEVLEADVLFRFPASLRAARHGRGRLVEERDAGSAVRRFGVRQVGPFLRWLLTFRGDAEVLSPPSLRRELRSAAAEVAALYAMDGARGVDGAPREDDVPGEDDAPREDGASGEDGGPVDDAGAGPAASDG